MKRRSAHALLTLMLLFCAQHAAAQQQPAAQSSGEAEAERRAELEKSAVALLREAVSEAQGLKLFENRVRPQTAAAVLLWTRDEPTARILFKSSAEALAAYSASLDPEDPQFYNVAQSVVQLRAELIQAVAQYDPKLALEYMRSTRLPHADALRASGLVQDSQEQQLELNLAARVASEDPARAMRMAEQSLSKGLTPSLISVLQQLRVKDPEAASKLATEIVKRMRVEDLVSRYEVSALASQLLSLVPADGPQQQSPSAQSAPVIVADGPTAGTFVGLGETSIRTTPAPPLMDRQTRAELVEKLIAAAMIDAPNQSGAYNLYNSLRVVLPEVERMNPARAEALRRRADALERSFNPQADAWRPYKQVSETGTADAMLEAAQKAPPEVRESLYTQAAWKAFNEGDAERARQIVENISNPQQRGQMRRNIEMQLQSRAVQQGNYAEARAAVARLGTFEEKASALMQIAGAALSKNDAKAARQALDEARSLAASQPGGLQQFNTQLQVAAAYSQLDAGESFEMVESSVARLNELLDAAASLEGFGQDSFKEGELRPQYGYAWNEMVNQCTATLAALAPADFERASAAAKSFRRADVRASAELQLAERVLGMLSQNEFQMRNRLPAGVSGGRWYGMKE
jgi:hypothetical protein